MQERQIDMTKPKNPPKTLDALSGNLQDFFKAINHDNDLACVLVTTNYLDQCAATLLRKLFREKPSTCDRVFDLGQPLSTFYSRYTLAYCLNLINSETLTNLSHIGDIRNLFAHKHPELTFDDEEVQIICGKLKLPKISGVEISEKSAIPLTQKQFEEGYKTPKDRFTLVASLLGMSLLVTASKTKRCDQKGPTLLEALTEDT
jgi:DNA-binding MltR family transcriptional regulator